MLTVWHLLTLLLAALFALFAFVLAAELDDGDGEEDSQDPEAHSDAYSCRVDPAAWRYRGGGTFTSSGYYYKNDN